jgi:GH24 family phage-related lysozyme (muramidase)
VNSPHPTLACEHDHRLQRAGAVSFAFIIGADLPQPSTFALMLPALCMAGLMAGRRRKKG